MSDEKEQDPKLVVDEDWKAQVARERAEMRAKERREKREHGHDPVEGDFPPASFPMLISTFASQAMVSLGVIPDPTTQQPRINRPLAKHFIDMLAVIEQKTKGNLDEDESQMLEEALHHLRMTYVTPVTPPKDEGAGAPPSKLELP